MAQISIHGKTLNTCGELPEMGKPAPDFSLVSNKLKDVTLADFTGKTKILCIMPSLDTPTCAASARKFNEKAAKLQNVVVLMVSADLPFAQSRFCETEGLKNVLALSTFRSDFAREYGVRLENTFLAGLTARAVVIIDEKNQVTYTQLVKEIADEPDYDEVLQALT